MDANTLSKAMGGALSLARYQELLPYFNAAMIEAGATTPLRAAHFCSQVGHESGGLYYFREIHDGSNYEGRTDLGNTQPGDGRRFRGRGIIQLTGRYWATEFSEWAYSKGLVNSSTYFVDNPEQMETDKWGCKTASFYWTVARPGLNALCDADDVVGVTKAINGGTNGLADRRLRLATCKALGAALLPSGTSTTGGETVGLDYYNVEPHATKLTSSYTEGRNGKTINCIYRHHMAGNGNLASCVALWNTSQTSAHYTVNATGGIGQAVYDSNTAWATGNTEGNERGISIEHANSTGRVNGSDTNPASWNMTDATIIGGARLAAALCRYYKLGRPVYGVNIKDHKDVRQTFCPGHLANGGMYHQKWMDEAQRFYDCLINKTVNPDGTAKSGTTTSEEDGMTDEDRKMLQDIHYQLLNKWPQLGGHTLVDTVALLLDFIAGPGKDFTGWEADENWGGTRGKATLEYLSTVLESIHTAVAKK